MNQQVILRWTEHMDQPAFIYRHVVSFEETNVVGNVYYVRHVAWQGRCREMFLKEHAPEVIDQIARDLRLVTLRLSCAYFEELHAFDEIDISMRLAHLHAHRIGLDFEYARPAHRGRAEVARGFQEIGCMRATSEGLVPYALPEGLLNALKGFRGNSPCQSSHSYASETVLEVPENRV